MRRFIEVKPKCGECGGSLEIDKIQIDLPNCAYILFCSCLLCGEENVEILRLEDFIEISQILNGGQDERNS